MGLGRGEDSHPLPATLSGGEEFLMHYYKRNLGDYAKKAGRLTMLQHGAYTLLLDACYDREQFPTLSEALDWTWASTTAEEEAVRFVLGKFFTLEGDVYVQKRIQEEIDDYKRKADTNARIAREREAKRHQSSTNRVRVVNEPPPNQEPRTKNQEPLTTPNGVDAAAASPTKRATRLPAGWSLPKAWGDWALREYPAWTGRIVRLEAAKFADHWRAKGGKDGAKLDWEATWRNWCRSDICQRTHSQRQTFAQQAADVARSTVPSKPGKDPALAAIEQDLQKAAPMPAELRAHIESITGKLKVQP